MSWDAFLGVRDVIFRGTIFTGTMLFIIMGILLVLLCITFLLRRFFKRHPLVDRAHRMLIYLLTMAGVLTLLLAGMLGAVLPIIPGIVFVFLALLLLRRYHRWRWLDRKMRLLSRLIRRTSFGRRYYAWRKRVHERRLAEREQHLREKRQKIQEKLNKLREERRQQR